ncbi:MAG: DUF3179 domain-containing protein [Acidobacteria bacterium]|nr:DUF3179 domain-containing protein [Acidobacteriota bacterium]MCA1612033.1 DUF3179 domain-containing protein [Acidobacteriota bacterium]MCA1617226.1 DUF3179 domain-containing protein [Acidobacteriota bacterium]
MKTVDRGRQTRRGKILRSLPGLAALALAFGCFTHRYRDNPRVAVVAGDPLVQMAPAADFKSVDRATMVPLARHTRTPHKEDLVLGIALSGGARAYPLGLLDRFEIVNDEMGDSSYVVVRCALTGVAAVWNRRLRGRTLLFESTGALWRDTLVFRDRETATYWSAATGVALSGPLAGERLSGIAGVVTRGGRWGEAHPESLYLDLGEKTTAPLLMKIYRLSAMQGVSGEKTSDRRHKPKEEMLVLASGDEALAFTPRQIERRERVDTEIGGERVTIEWEPELAAPRACASDGNERPLFPMFWFALDRHFATVRTLD